MFIVCELRLAISTCLPGVIVLYMSDDNMEFTFFSPVVFAASMIYLVYADQACRKVTSIKFLQYMISRSKDKK
jgi:hypothetical protein